MTDKKVLWVRILVAIATFLALTGTIISYWHKRFGPEYFYPGPIYSVLFILAFFTLANGVSYFLEILRKDKNYLKLLTGILSLIVFVITFFPQDQDMNPILGLTVLIGLSSSSILISAFSTLAWVQKKRRLLLLFIFAFNGGVYGCLIFAMILRGYNFSEGGILMIGYGAVLFLINITVNLFVVASLKNKIRGKQ